MVYQLLVRTTKGNSPRIDLTEIEQQDGRLICMAVACRSMLVAAWMAIQSLAVQGIVTSATMSVSVA